MATSTGAGLPLMPAAVMPPISAPSLARDSAFCAASEDLSGHERPRIVAEQRSSLALRCWRLRMQLQMSYTGCEARSPGPHRRFCAWPVVCLGTDSILGDRVAEVSAHNKPVKQTARPCHGPGLRQVRAKNARSLPARC